MTLQETASRIQAHLRRMEKDPTINVVHEATKLKCYYNASACCPKGGRKIRVSYISYQFTSTLSREEAERYLSWLDAGNSGTHRDAARDP
jgi:hypothetical protein